MSDLDLLWSQLLGRDSDTVRAAWSGLPADEQTAVYEHLQRMAQEEGWAEPQRLSAQAALEALADLLSPPGGGADAAPPKDG